MNAATKAGLVLLGAGLVLLGAGLVAAALVGVAALDRPRVEDVHNEWGTVTEERTEVETGLLEPLRTREETPIEAFGRTVLVVEGTDARWGDVTRAETPILASATVRNPTELPVPLTEFRYTIRTNGRRRRREGSSRAEVGRPRRPGTSGDPAGRKVQARITSRTGPPAT